MYFVVKLFKSLLPFLYLVFITQIVSPSSPLDFWMSPQNEVSSSLVKAGHGSLRVDEV